MSRLAIRKALVGSVASRCIFSVLTGTKPGLSRLFCFKDVGHKAGALVPAITERLPFGQAARAEGVFLTGLKFYFDWSCASDYRFVRHVFNS